MAKILLVEDDRDLANMVVQWLTAERYAVDICHDGRSGLDFLSINEYDVAIIDWDLPLLQGIDIVREFRGKGGDTPIIFLTGKDRISDKEQGFDSGADDYLTKPFSVRELAARIRALLRRPSQVVPSIMKSGDVELDPALHKVTRAGQEVHLSPKDFELLEFLMRHPDQVFSGDALLTRIWPSDSEATSDALRSAVKRIRKKLDSGENEADSIIENVPRVGYRIRSR
ncbi:MAG: response regulator transcription factor [Candidatus Melainabacteria bacterium]|nr:response regulator transcription factor [Candidatus Melainabacteria bacterium]